MERGSQRDVFGHGLQCDRVPAVHSCTLRVRFRDQALSKLRLDVRSRS